MGAQGSKARDQPGQSANPETQPQDYYDILQIDEDASQDEIKKSFRKLALALHPDKNPSDIEGATKRFAVIQQAYEVLSDEQERAWYDSHRASLIPEPDAADVFEDIKKGTTQARRRMNDPGLTVRHIMKFFDASIWKAFDESSDGFFSIYQNLFARLAADEASWSEENLDYPSFGSPDWPWIASAQSEQKSTRDFYNVWSSFVTAKDFAWKDQWDMSEAPDRRVRRLMEKDNKKAREESKKEYNETIRMLVVFLRKRDPRYKAHIARAAQPLSKPTSSTETGAAARKRKDAESQYVEQDWQKTKTSQHTEAHEEWGNGEWEEAEGIDEFECVACQKSFKSESAWGNHERSKKHLKEVQRLRRQMREENEEFELEESPGPELDLPDPLGGVGLHPLIPNVSHQPGEIETQSRETIPSGVESNKVHNAPKEVHFHNDTLQPTVDPAPDESSVKSDLIKFGEGNVAQLNVEGSMVVPVAEQSEDATSDKGEEVSTSNALPQLSKKDKRRAKEAQKKQQAAGLDQAPTQKCHVCQQSFESRTKLFSHVKETGHAAAEPENTKGRRKGVTDEKAQDTKTHKEKRKARK